VTDFLDEKRQEIRSRMAELKPLVDEFQRLQTAASALEGVLDGANPPTPARGTASATRRGPGRPRGSRGPGRPPGSRRAPGRPAASKKQRTTPSAPPITTRRGRRKGSGKRPAEALVIVQEQPGVTVPELAARTGIKQNYLYRVLSGLAEEGKVRKEGRGWHPVHMVTVAKA
jgi:hypothetical protein